MPMPELTRMPRWRYRLFIFGFTMLFLGLAGAALYYWGYRWDYIEPTERAVPEGEQKPDLLWDAEKGDRSPGQ